MEVILNPTTDNSTENIQTQKLDEITPLLKLSQDFEVRGFPNEAIKCLKQLYNVSNPFFAHAQIGHLHYRTNDFGAAKAEYLDCLLEVDDKIQDNHLQASEDLFNVYKNLGNIYLKESDILTAKSFYAKASAIKQESSELYVNLGTLDLIEQNEESAIEKFRKAIYVNNSNDKAWVGLALVYENFGENELTEACLKKALDLNTKNINALHLFAQFCNKNDKHYDGIQYLENWILKNEFNSEVYSYLIELYLNTNQIQKAQFLIEEALLWDPKHEVFSQWSEQINLNSKFNG